MIPASVVLHQRSSLEGHLLAEQYFFPTMHVDIVLAVRGKGDLCKKNTNELLMLAFLKTTTGTKVVWSHRLEEGACQLTKCWILDFVAC